MAADVPESDARLVTFDDVLAAQKAITGMVVHTPTMRSQTLSNILGLDVWVKFENLQFTSSFKDRGACNRLLQLTPDEVARGVIAMSAGNHAQGVAYHATRLGIPSTIVMPQYTPNVKVAGTEALGARVVLHGADIIEAKSRAEELAVAGGLVWVPPFDDPAIIAGQGTVAIEMLEDAPEIDTIVVPVGGGGLIAGMAIAAAALRPDVEVVGVETELYPSMVAALDGGATVIPGGQTVAEGIAVGVSGALTTPIVRELVAETLIVQESTIEHAMNLFLDIEKTVAEGAGAAGLAAAIEHRDRFLGRKVGLVLTGGNVDPRILASVIMRGLVRSGRLARLDVDISDIPGSLARVTTIIGELGGNIVEVAHQRLYSDLTIRSAVLELAIETRDRPHTERIITGLTNAGYHVVNRGT